MWAMVNADCFLGSHWNPLGRIRVKKNSANKKLGRALGSITSRCSGNCARTHPPAEGASITSQTRSIGHASSRLSSGRIKDRTRETAEIEPSVAPNVNNSEGGAASKRPHSFDGRTRRPKWIAWFLQCILLVFTSSKFKLLSFLMLWQWKQQYEKMK